MKKFLLLFLILCCSINSTLAADFTVNGINYDVISYDNYEVRASGGSPDADGLLVIPSKVTYNNFTFTVKTISGGAFSFKHIKKLQLSEGLKTIGQQAFRNTDIEELTIPNSVETIEFVAFGNCAKLKHINLGTGLKNLGTSISGVFGGCTSLEEIVIPDNVEFLGRVDFQGCTQLKKVVIGSGITKFGGTVFDATNPDDNYNGVFNSCDNIVEVYSRLLNPMDIGNGNFTFNVYSKATLYVPVGTKEIYQQKNGWKRFAVIKEDPSCGEVTGIHNIFNQDEKTNIIYDMRGMRLNKPQKGINIINGKKVLK